MGNLRLSRRDSAKILAGERDLTAWHEAGHAVAHVVTGLSFHDVRIWVESERRGWRRERRWEGVVRPAPDDEGCWVPDEQLPALAVAVLAGPEAEARRIHQTSDRHYPLQAIRAGVEEDHGYAGGDFDGLPELLADAGLTRAEADRSASELVTAWWPQITRVAGILHTTRAMTAAEVAALVHGARDHAA